MGRKKPADVIFTGWAVAMIVSERVVALLTENQFTGWSTYPVMIIARGGEVIPGFHGFAVTGRCGPEDKSKRVLFRKEMPGGEFDYLRGLYFDPAQWDGSDVSMFSDRFTFVFRREVVEAFRRAKVTNIDFQPLSEVEQMYMPWM